ncbi:MAG: prepilin peptidase [Alphaproteobacteria bacterium]|nr:prepilin peptidase [Alphaproteobacteria bacterium]
MEAASIFYIFFALCCSFALPALVIYGINYYSEEKISLKRAFKNTRAHEKPFLALIFATTILGSIAIALQPYSPGQHYAALLFAYVLIVLSFIDSKLYILPDFLTFPLIATGLLVALLGLFIPLLQAFLGMFFGYSSLWLINRSFLLLRNKEGMGQGDFKLLAAIGAWVGPMQLPLIIFAAALIGLLMAAVTRPFSRATLGSAIPFGPALALAGFLSLLYGDNFLNWYLSLFL